MNKSSTDSDKLQLENDNFILSFEGLPAHPWLDSRKKAIIIDASLFYGDTSQGSFVLSDLVLSSGLDSFTINFNNKNLKNQFILEQDTLKLTPHEKDR